MGEVATSLFDNPPKGWTAEKFGGILAEPVRNGIYKKKEFHGRGQKIVNMGELFAYGFISGQEMKRVALNVNERSKYLLQDGDLLFARRSLVLEGSGKCSLVVRPCEETTFESSIIRARLNQAEADPRFYYYFWSSPLGRALMASIATRTAVSGIRGSDLVQLKVPVPPLPTQRKIAAILSAYDDLIENNTRRIAVLEEMAQAIYREWFVRFRFPGHEQVAMVDSELGSIPEGWEAATVADLYRTSSGGTPSRKAVEYFGGSINWVKTRELGDSFIFETEERITDLGLQKSSAKLFPANTVIMAMYGATIGRLSILALPAATNQACCALLEAAPLFGHSYAFLYLLENRNKLIGLGMGAAQQNISQRVIKSFRMLKPASSVLRRFNDFADPILDQIRVLQREAINLRRIRDLLLPRLISGEIDVSDLNIDGG